MATITGTVQRAWGFQRPVGPEHTHTVSAVEYETEMCFVGVTFPTGTYAQADDANFNAATVIQNTKRDGKTITIVSAACVGAGDENGTIVACGLPTGISSNVVTLPILQEDLATERAAGAVSATWNKDIVMAIWYYQPVEG